MFSRKCCGLLLALSLIVSSCTPKVGEDPPGDSQNKIEATECLSDLKPIVTKFGEGSASDAEIAQAWDCAALALKKFKQYVYSRQYADRYSADELMKFLEDNFLDASSPKISPALRAQFMKFKQIFIGGSSDSLTRAEIDSSIQMFIRLKGLTLRLNPYMKIVAQTWINSPNKDPRASVTYFENASDEVQAVTVEISNIIAAHGQSYKMDDFLAFLNEFQKFCGQEWSFTQQVAKFLPAVKKVKSAITGGDPEVIAIREWQGFMQIGVRGYLQYLRYYYFISTVPNTGSGIRLGYLARSLEDLLGAFQDLLQNKPTDPGCGFETLPDGSHRDYSCISKQEIYGMLKSFSDIWTDFKVSEKLVAEGMKIKKMYFGGTTDSITSRDFERGKKKVASLKIVVEKFMPYYSIYAMEWDRDNMDPATAQKFFKDAQGALATSAEQLGLLFEDSYSMDSLIQLLTEVDTLYLSQDPTKKLAPVVQKYLPVVKDIKTIVFSDSNADIQQAQWSPFLKYAARVYADYLYYHYFIQTGAAATFDYLESLKTFSDQSLNIALDIVNSKKNKVITEAEIKMLVNDMVTVGLLPDDVTPKSVEQLVRVILNQILWPTEMRLKKVFSNGISPVTLDYISDEFQIWYETEKFNLQMVGNGTLKPDSLQDILAGKLKAGGLSDALRAGLSEISIAVSGSTPQTVDSAGRLIISNIQPQAYDAASLSRLNLSRSVARLLTRASITDLGRLKRYEGVTQKEAQALYDQVKPFCVDAGLVNPMEGNFVDSRFREANIFTAHGNGDNYVNFAEMSDVVGMITSGVVTNSFFRQELVAACLPANSVVTGLSSVSEKCLLQVYYTNTNKYMTSMPEYLKFFRKVDQDDWQQYFTNVMKAAGYVRNSKRTVHLSDADQTAHVIQYIEMIMARYDANKNGVINVSEARKAFPAFQGILLELTKDQSLIKPKDLLALFTYILHYGEPPGGVWEYMTKWIPWRSNEDKWVVNADRQQLASILGYIADTVRKSSPTILSAEDEEAIRRDPNYSDN